jgi:hypothetical protein
MSFLTGAVVAGDARRAGFLLALERVRLLLEALRFGADADDVLDALGAFDGFDDFVDSCIDSFDIESILTLIDSVILSKYEK